MRRRIFPDFIGDVAQLEERQQILERIMQSIGFSPENPYTLIVNDGTLNRVFIGKIGSDYGINILDNAGNSILLANGTIVANAIKSGTLDCSLITVTNLNAGSITTGTISATKISGGTLDCNLMTVANLSASVINAGQFSSPNDRFPNTSIHGDKIQTGTLNADRIIAHTISADRIVANSITTNEINSMNGSKLVDGTVSNQKVSWIDAAKITSGVIEAGRITADNITAGTLTGRTVRTAGSGARVELNGPNNRFEVYNSSALAGYIQTYNNNIGIIGGIGYQVVISGSNYTHIWDNYLIVDDLIYSRGHKLEMSADATFAQSIYVGGGRIQVNGYDKAAIMKLDGKYRTLFCAEAPEVWFFDFCKNKKSIDPLFLAATVGKKKFVKCDDGTYQVWRRRKGHAHKRFTIKTEEQFERNNRFWSMPDRMLEGGVK